MMTGWDSSVRLHFIWIEVVVVPAADHGFKVPASAGLSQAEALEFVVETTLGWLVREIVGNR